MAKAKRVALNVIQWMGDPNATRSYDDPAFLREYPEILRQVREAGFTAVAMKVAPTQTVQQYQRMLADAGLYPAPGYASVALPAADSEAATPGTREHHRWFDGVRRRAEESNVLGLGSVFLAPGTGDRDAGVRSVAAIGADADPDRLARMSAIIGEAAEILRQEGVTAGLHNHVGAWIEVESEIVYVLDHNDPAALRASFDIGHLVWAGIDPVAMVQRYQDRLLDLHVKDLDLDLVRESREHPVPYHVTAEKRFFLEMGLGGIDYDAVLRALPTNFGGWIVIEVDRPSMDPFESAKVSRAWVDAKLGGTCGT